MAEKINVMHIIQNSKRGGVQLQLLNLLAAYDRTLITPTVCCLGVQDEVGRLMEERGIDFVALNVKRHYRFSPLLITALFRLMKKRNIHVVRAHKYSSSIYGRVAAWLARVPVVITSVHGNYHKDLRSERRAANKILAKATDRIVAMSESIRRDIIEHDGIDPAKVIVVRNGVDTELFNPATVSRGMRKELGFGAEDAVVGFVGRLVPAKGLGHLIDAFAAVWKEHPRARLLLVGGGQLMDSLRDAVREKGLQEHVLFAGERSDIPELLAAMDVFVMPSLAEGLPNALLEAMAMAKPLVVTEAGGMPEIIQHEVNGLVVPVGDSASLGEAIGRLIRDQPAAEVMGRAARQYVENRFSIRAAARTWQALYGSLLESKGRFLRDRQSRID